MAFGKRGYYYAAFNMAQSIKYYNPQINITLVHDGGHINELHHLGFFHKVIQIDKNDLYDDGVLMSPAKAKINVYKYLQYDHNLYLDVDGMALQDVEPILTHCMEMDKPYLTEVRGSGKKGDKINYDIWAKHTVTWPFFDLDENASWPAIQSSFAYIRKCDESKKIFDLANEYYNKGFDTKNLTMKWGGTVPDELIFSGTCAKLGYNPNAKIYPIFFGWQHVTITLTQISDKYRVLSLYGNGKGKTLTKRIYIEYYDRLMRAICREQGVPYVYKSLHIMRDKHAG